MKHILMSMCLLLTTAAWAQEGLPRVYEEEKNPLEQIDQALTKAAEEGKFVVCQVGGNWCPWCLRFAAFAKRDTAVSRVIDENFIYIHVNYNPRKQDNPELAKSLMRRLGYPARFGFPVFVVLDEKGHIRHTQDSGYLEEGKGYDQEKVIRFFQNWTPKAVRGEE